MPLAKEVATELRTGSCLFCAMPLLELNDGELKFWVHAKAEDGRRCSSSVALPKADPA